MIAGDTQHPRNNLILHLAPRAREKWTKQYGQFGTQVKFRWSRDRNSRTAENAYSAPWFFSEMELEPAAS